MREWLVITALLTFLGVNVLTAGAKRRPEDLRASIFTLHISMTDSPLTSECTTFSVGRGKFVTAGHCVAVEGTTFAIEDRQSRQWPATISAVDVNLDVATLKSDLIVPALPAGRDPQEDDQVFTLSGVGGNGLFTLRGRVAGYNHGYIVIQLPSQGPGGSGSPILCGDAVCAISLGSYPVSRLTAALATSRWIHLLEQEQL